MIAVAQCEDGLWLVEVGEAPVALAIARRTRALLVARGYRVAMTRERAGYTGGNVDRAKFCNARRAALMIRIHADGSTNSSQRGVHTLYPALHRGWTDDVFRPSLLAATLIQREVVRVETGRDAARMAEAESLRRLERDIHDGPQQRLVRLGMDLGRARRQLEQDPDRAAATIDEALAQARETVAELRSLSRGIAPPLLVDRGLAAALEEMLAQCDVVTINCPLHEKTKGLFNKELLNKMKPGKCLTSPVPIPPFPLTFLLLSRLMARQHRSRCHRQQGGRRRGPLLRPASRLRR